MKKSAALVVFLLLLAAPSFAVYVVIMKDGTRYKAKQKWTVSGTKAIITLDNGSVVQVETSEIDIAKTEETNKLGLGDAKLINVPQAPQPTPSQQQKKSSGLGGVGKLRELPGTKPATAPTTPATSSSSAKLPPPATNKPSDDGSVPSHVISKFEKAYENVGLFNAKITSNGSRILHVELPADNEDHVFKAISATSFVLSNLPQVANGATLDQVELYMMTMRQGAAGRFHMTPEDATKITNKQISWQNYYVSKVLF